MNHIDEVEAIIEEITSQSISQQDFIDGNTGMYLSPSDYVNTMHLEEVYYYDLVLYDESLDDFESISNSLLRCKTNLDFNYNNFDARGYISVSNGLLFSVDDEITGATSNATGTIYKIVDDTLYLKDVTGTWQSGETITGYSATTTTTLITTIFPYYINVKKVKEYYNPSDLPMKSCYAWFRFEARWTL